MVFVYRRVIISYRDRGMETRSMKRSNIRLTKDATDCIRFRKLVTGIVGDFFFLDNSLVTMNNRPSAIYDNHAGLMIDLYCMAVAT